MTWNGLQAISGAEHSADDKEKWDWHRESHGNVTPCRKVKLSIYQENRTRSVQLLRHSHFSSWVDISISLHAGGH